MQLVIDNLNTIKNTNQNVYNAGKESMIDRDKVIEKTANGNPVAIDDVSEIPHTVGIKVKNTKNLIPYPYDDGESKTMYGLTWTVNPDRSISATGNQTGWSRFNLGSFDVIEGETYTVKAHCNEELQNICLDCQLKDIDGNKIKSLMRYSKEPLVIDTSLYPGIAYILVTIALSYNDREVICNNLFVQAERGSTATEYVDYNTPAVGVEVTLTENGTVYTTDSNGCFECDSLSPNMTFVCDDVVDITVNYWKSWGMQIEYDRFWDRYQEKGNRGRHYNAFSSLGADAWWYDNFKPKYDMKPTDAQYMFWQFGRFRDEPFNLKQQLIDCGVEMDFSQCKGMFQVFNGSTFSHIPYLNCSNSTEFFQTFWECLYLETIDGIYLTKVATFTEPFKNCYKLKNISFDGEIGNSIDFQWSPLLTVESLRSILTALSKDATQANGKTITFNTASKAVIEADYDCASELALAVGAGWTVAYA